MSRSGYRDDYEPDDTASFLRSCAYPYNVERHMGGRAGQAFLWELYLTLTDLPSQELVEDTMQDAHGGVCALGAVGVRRGRPFPEDLRTPDDCDDEWDFAEGVAAHLGIKDMMAREVMDENDSTRVIGEIPGPPQTIWSSRPQRYETDHERWARMRRWCVRRLRGIP
jgi:hypothetical protein